MIRAINIHRVNLHTGYQPKDIRYLQVRFPRFYKLPSVRNMRGKRIVFNIDAVVGHAGTNSVSFSSTTSAGASGRGMKHFASYPKPGYSINK